MVNAVGFLSQGLWFNSLGAHFFFVFANKRENGKIKMAFLPRLAISREAVNTAVISVFSSFQRSVSFRWHNFFIWRFGPAQKNTFRIFFLWLCKFGPCEAFFSQQETNQSMPSKPVGREWSPLSFRALACNRVFSPTRSRISQNGHEKRDQHVKTNRFMCTLLELYSTTFPWFSFMWERGPLPPLPKDRAAIAAN